MRACPWKNFANATGNGTFVPLGSEDSGILWFFTPASFELMIKIVDGCSLNNRYWVFLAALTNVEFPVTVYATWTDTTKPYDTWPMSVVSARTESDRMPRTRSLPKDPISYFEKRSRSLPSR